MVRLYIPPLPQPTASTLVVVDCFLSWLLRCYIFHMPCCCTGCSRLGVIMEHAATGQGTHLGSSEGFNAFQAILIYIYIYIYICPPGKHSPGYCRAPGRGTSRHGPRDMLQLVGINWQSGSACAWIAAVVLFSIDGGAFTCCAEHLYSW
jgi:hypothetical protein